MTLSALDGRAEGREVHLAAGFLRTPVVFRGSSAVAAGVVTAKVRRGPRFLRVSACPDQRIGIEYFEAEEIVATIRRASAAK